MAALATDEIYTCFDVRIKKRAMWETVKEHLHIIAFRNKGSRDYYYYYYYYYYY